MSGIGISFDPLIPWAMIAALGALGLASVAAAWFRGLSGWWLRGFGLGVIVLALAGPELRQEERQGLPSVAFLVVDKSDSATLEERSDEIARAAETLTARIRAASTPERPLDLRVVEVETDPEGNAGTQLLTALSEEAARIAPDQIAGAALLTDGQI
ncbi:MAG: hypothetical protein AAF568_08335, partial [Pseudomonadota bacterium]